MGVGVGGAAGGGWLMAGGGLGAKLAVGCLVAVSVGAGCVALTVGPILPSHARAHRRHLGHGDGPHIAYEALSSSPVGAQLTSGVGFSSRAGASRAASATGAALTPAAKAGREFGLEQSARQVSATVQPSVSDAARAASVGQTSREFSGSAARSSGSGSSSGGPGAQGSGGSSVAAAREFGLGG